MSDLMSIPSSPVVDPAPNVDAPLDSFTQELVRENELLIADVDQLRENEDRLIAQITALQTQLQEYEGHLTRELSVVEEQLITKEDEIDTLRREKDEEISKLKEELLSARHTLSLMEDSSQAHHEQLEQLELELEEAKQEIQQLKSAAEEAREEVRKSNEQSARQAAATAEIVEKAVSASLSEMNTSVRYMHATIQSIFKSIRGNMVFSLYGDPIYTNFEEQPTPTLSIAEHQVETKTNELANLHKKMRETLRRVEGFTEAAGSQADHPLRTFIGTSIEACTLLVSLYVGISKIGLHSARHKYVFAAPSGDSATSSAVGAAASGGAAAAASSVNEAAGSNSNKAAAPSTARGLGLWAR